MGNNLGHEYEVHPRDLKFDFSSLPRHWLNGDPYVTHMFNASSLFLPYIEGLVNFIVLSVIDNVENKHFQLIYSNFVKQETLHAREHIKYNLILKKNNYQSDQVVTKIKNTLRSIKKTWSPLSVLAIAVGFESITASISQVVLEDKILDTAEPTIKRFWQWHMMEELEHKSVLMDLYQQLNGGYFRRVALFTVVLWCYCYYGLKIYLNLLKVDKVSIFRGLICVLRKESFFRKSVLRSLRSYWYRYHPRQTKTEHLIDFESMKY